MLALCALVFLVSAGLLLWYYQGAGREAGQLRQLAALKAQADEKQTDAAPEESSSPLGATGLETLAAQNPDLAGWITIEGTNIDYPVMQRDMQFYLRHDFEGAPSKMGLPFADVRCDVADGEQNLVIYAHNMNSGAMFRDLLRLQQPEYLARHSRIRLETLAETREYQVSSTLSFNDGELTEDIYANEGLLVLITCTNQTETGRFAVFAKRI